MQEPTPSDKKLIVLYRTFSQECWCAGWIGDPDSMADEFIAWLREDRRESEERGVLDFEVAAVPTLRKLYAAAFETIDGQATGS